ncbi:MAG: YceD family protein, partial [Acidimicrobiales bacterium]
GEHRPEVRRGEIPGLFVTSSGVPVGSEVEVDVVLTPVGRAVEVAGVVRAGWQGDCRRCLRPVSGSLETPVREVFEPDHEEGETYPLAHDEIDLEALARDTVMLELPPAPLCHETCQGFCPTCGVDRNECQCSCAPALDPRWSVLEELRDSE